MATGVFSLVLITMGFALVVPNYRPWKLSNPKLEMWWSLGPLLLILIMLIPSTVILYLREANFFPVGGAKVIGHQWYWEFEIPSCKPYEEWSQKKGEVYAICCDSYGIVEEDLQLGEERWVSTDSRLVLPSQASFRLVCTSEDVIHNWNLKSSGTSVDCVPGRLNQHRWLVDACGVFSGLCSELCGVGHSHMPCGAESILYRKWLNWLAGYFE
uniref:Cytochrome c oxidase subunit 2 n=1 Tax=Spirobranchus giganteus TaxID=1914524 RepID=A0A1I9WKC0_9ANNE|nr:cytochrome c oxidase subunit II [Spirobranchus giganteus]APA32615.1 Cytochrome oxidase subunit 2 [Spirobranchus giganteus]